MWNESFSHLHHTVEKIYILKYNKLLLGQIGIRSKYMKCYINMNTLILALQVNAIKQLYLRF
jgi:hypothetical protein